ncbi:MAG: glycosyltransferase [Sulfuricaulis sp.]
MGTTDFHEADLRVLGGVVGRWMRDHPDAEFVAAGDPGIHDVLGIPEGQRVSTSHVFFRCMDLPDILAFDVGLAPLVRNPFNEGKSCLKGMEYNAAGIPVLASPTEDYRRWVEDGVNGFLCQRPRDFVARLDELYGDWEKLGRMRELSRLRARGASIDRNVGLWEDWFGGFGDGDYAHGEGARAAA